MGLQEYSAYALGETRLCGRHGWRKDEEEVVVVVSEESSQTTKLFCFVCQKLLALGGGTSSSKHNLCNASLHVKGQKHRNLCTQRSIKSAVQAPTDQATAGMETTQLKPPCPPPFPPTWSTLFTGNRVTCRKTGLVGTVTDCHGANTNGGLEYFSNLMQDGQTLHGVQRDELDRCLILNNYKLPPFRYIQISYGDVLCCAIVFCCARL